MLGALDAGHDVIRLTHLLADLPSDEMKFAAPATHPDADAEHEGTHPRLGVYRLRAYGHLHLRLASRTKLSAESLHTT